MPLTTPRIKVLNENLVKFLSRHKLLIIPLALATLFRVIYWLQVKEDAWFLAPGTDSEFYLHWANDILHGQASSYFPFPRAPLYAYLLAGIQAIFGNHWLIPRLLNLFADLGTIILLFKLGKRLKSDSTGFIAALIWAISGSVIYFSGEILMTSLACLLFTAFLYSILSMSDKPSLTCAVFSAVWLTLLCMLRPNFLLFVPLNVLFFVWLKMAHKLPSKTTAIYIILHLSAILLILSPVTIANYRAADELLAVSAQGGVNFYIGNVRGASGWSSELPGAGSTWDEENARRIASEHAGRKLSHAASSTEFWKMGLEEILTDPLAWVKLMGKKTLLYLSILEIGNNRPLSLAWNSSGVLNILRWLSLGFFLPFAMIGWIQNRKLRNFNIMAIYAILFSASILIFFINSRYRLPLLPVLSIFAASGVVWLKDNWQSLARERFVSVVFIVAAMLSYIPWYSNTGEQPAQIEFFAGNAALRQNNKKNALSHFQKALALNPTTPNLNLNIGVIQLATGDTAKAQDSFLRELSLNYQNSEALNNLGVIAEQRGELSNAENYYRRAYDLNPSSDDHKLNLWRILMKQGDQLLSENRLDNAFAYYLSATTVVSSDARTWYKMAVIRYSQGIAPEAVDLLQNALQASPDYIPAQQMLNAITSAE